MSIDAGCPRSGTGSNHCRFWCTAIKKLKILTSPGSLRTCLYIREASAFTVLPFVLADHLSTIEATAAEPETRRRRAPPQLERPQQSEQQKQSCEHDGISNSMHARYGD